MNWLNDVSLDELMQLKPKGFYRIATVDGFTVCTVCTVCRPNEPPERFLCHSIGHANQVRLALSDEGLCGFIEATA